MRVELFSYRGLDNSEHYKGIKPGIISMSFCLGNILKIYFFSLPGPQADPESPVFKSKFNSVEQLIVTRFTSLKLAAKQEAIASLEMFVLGLFQRFVNVVNCVI